MFLTTFLLSHDFQHSDQLFNTFVVVEFLSMADPCMKVYKMDTKRGFESSLQRILCRNLSFKMSMTRPQSWHSWALCAWMVRCFGNSSLKSHDGPTSFVSMNTLQRILCRNLSFKMLKTRTQSWHSWALCAWMVWDNLKKATMGLQALCLWIPYKEFFVEI